MSVTNLACLIKSLKRSCGADFGALTAEIAVAELEVKMRRTHVDETVFQGSWAYAFCRTSTAASVASHACGDEVCFVLPARGSEQIMFSRESAAGTTQGYYAGDSYTSCDETASVHKLLDNLRSYDVGKAGRTSVGGGGREEGRKRRPAAMTGGWMLGSFRFRGYV